MKSPITGKEMKLYSQKQLILYKGVEVIYYHQFYADFDNGEEFTTTELDEGNLKRIEEQYNIIIGHPNKI